MRLISINRNGSLAGKVNDPPPVLDEILAGTAAMYRISGYEAPWIAYVAIEDGQAVGSCGFKSAPRVNRVEIAYFTFPGHEGRGVAKRMARALIDIAHRDRPGLVVTALTEAKDSASTHILDTLGFARTGTVAGEDGDLWEWVLNG